LCFDQTSPTKDYGFGRLDLVTTVGNASFTILLEHLPPQLEIAGYYRVLLHHAKILR
jgi:hypothetical protein